MQKYIELKVDIYKGKFEVFKQYANTYIYVYS